MFRLAHHEWTLSNLRASQHRKSKRRSTSASFPFHRRLRIEPLEDRRLLALVTVDTLADTVDFSDGVTSLREAIFATNLVGGADTIDFAAALTSGSPATLTLTQGELAITDALAINGPGANLLTIDASGNDPTPDSTLEDGDATNDGDGIRVFNIDDGNNLVNIDISISGLTLTGGDASGSGGAIRSLENLALADSTISGNTANFLSVSNRGNGGGIEHYGSGNLTVTGSTISGNSASRDGGGIRSSGSSGNLTVTGSTISGNSATSASGGGISGGTITVTDSTISGNSARFNGSGISGGTITVTGSTISGNSASSQLSKGGGIRGNNITVTGSTISNNWAFDGGGIDAEGPNNSITVMGSTISGNSGYNGGGIAAAIVTVKDSTISGNSAYQGGGILAIATIVDSTISGNSAVFGGGIKGEIITVTGSTISGNSAAYGGGDFENFGDGGGIFGTRITVTGSTISGNSASDDGGGIYSRNTLAVTGSTISGNTASGVGGGIYSSNTLAVTDSTISGNSASGYGGGIAANHLTVTGSTIDGNSTSRDGGGIASLGIATITGSTISGNSASRDGGGILKPGGSLTVTGSTIGGNSAGRDGGGIFNAGGSLTVTSSTISDNAAANEGGGIFRSLTGNLTVTNSTISDNSAAVGGGVFLTAAAAGTFLVRHSTVTANAASATGGGLFVAGGTLTVNQTIVAQNLAGFGPDLTGLLGAVFDVRFSLIGSNANSGLGGAPLGAPDANGNLIGTAVSPIDPLLGPLASNGGPTLTHALLAGSPAIDAGNPAFAPPPDFDQRGAPLPRVFDGDGAGGARIDIGAFELQPIPAAIFGDYNQDDTVDAADYVVWRKMLGTMNVPAYSGADGDGDTTIDQDDYGVWRARFGQTLPVPAGVGGAAALSFTESKFEVGETVAPLSAASIVTPVESKADAMREANTAMFEARTGRHDTVSPPRERNTFLIAAKSANDKLLLALAIDRVGRASHRDAYTVDGRIGDDQLGNGSDLLCLTDDPLDLALAEWR